MSQLLLAATIPLVLLVGIISADIMGFAVWKSNKFQVEGKVCGLPRTGIVFTNQLHRQSS
jgi:predicted benzoate:H+ symporter BenE